MSLRFRSCALVAASLASAGAFAAVAPSAAPAPSASLSAHLAARPESDADYKKILDAAGDAVVTVKFVMKSPDDQGMGDSEEEVSGVVIGSNGLILCSYWFLGGMASMFPGGAAPKPQDIKILIGDDTEGKKARMISHDSELDLAWLKLEEEPASPLKHIDIEKGAAASVGQRVYIVSKLGKFFDRARVVNEGRIRGEAKTPRQLFAPGGSILSLADKSDIGQPVFNDDASVVGFMIIQIPDKEAMQASEDLGGGPMILPVDVVAKATKRALENQNAEPAKDEAKPAEPAAPAPAGEKK